MRISDWSSDVCSSDLAIVVGEEHFRLVPDRVTNPPIHLVAGLEEAPDIGLKQTGTQLGVDCGQLGARDDSDVAIERSAIERGIEKRDRAVIIRGQITNQDLSGLPGGDEQQDTRTNPDIPSKEKRA